MPAYRIERFWQVILKALDLPAGVLARRAGLSVGVFAADDPLLVDVEEWASLWDALEAEVDRPDLALELVQLISLEMMDPPLFAALCSENFYQAATRLQRFKRVIGPARLRIDEGQGFAVACEIDGLPLPPRLWGMGELVVWVAMVRRLTCHHVIPRRVVVPVEIEAPNTFETYFGNALTRGARYEVAFENEDARRPFLAIDASWWKFFEPALERRLAECETGTSTSQRLRAALFELLPSGRTQLRDVARVLATSPRTIQRRLAGEGTTYREILDATRAELAMQYLTRSEATIPEIALLLGYDDPNSLYPAFRAWTGTTPQAIRDGTQLVG